jgi:hypothetical protein
LELSAYRLVKLFNLFSVGCLEEKCVNTLHLIYSRLMFIVLRRNQVYLGLAISLAQGG